MAGAPASNCMKSIGFAEAKELALLDHFRNLLRDHVFPGGIVIFNSPEHVTRENVQDAFVEVLELLDSSAFNQMPVQAAYIGGHCDILDCPKLARVLVQQGIN